MKIRVRYGAINGAKAPKVCSALLGRLVITGVESLTQAPYNLHKVCTQQARHSTVF
jgi:hypothetical protein